MSETARQLWAGIGALVLLFAMAAPALNNGYVGTVSNEEGMLYVAGFCLVFVAPLVLTTREENE